MWRASADWKNSAGNKTKIKIWRITTEVDCKQFGVDWRFRQTGTSIKKEETGRKICSTTWGMNWFAKNKGP